MSVVRQCVDEEGKVAATWTNDVLSLVKHSHLRIKAVRIA